MGHVPIDKLPVIVVAEDEPLIRLGVADQLSVEGYEVIEAATASDAMAIVQARPDVRVLFTDIDMPGEFDGLELAERVHRRWPEVLLMVTSGRASLTDADIPDNGLFLSKPYSGPKLTAALKELFRRHEPHERD